MSAHRGSARGCSSPCARTLPRTGRRCRRARAGCRSGSGPPCPARTSRGSWKPSRAPTPRPALTTDRHITIILGLGHSCYSEGNRRVRIGVFVWTHGRTDARTHGRTDARTHGRTDAQTHRRTDARTNGRTEARTHGHTNARTPSR